MTNPLENAPQQVELLQPIDQALLDREAGLILHDHFQPSINEVAANLRKHPEPNYGYWEPCAKDYGRRLDFKLVDQRNQYENEARQKAPQQRDEFDKFVLGVSGNIPEDVCAPEGSHDTAFGYYNETGKRLLNALKEGRLPEGFEDPHLLEKATDFLLAKGVSQLLASPGGRSVDLKTAVALLREATERVPGFVPDTAGVDLLINTSINCKGVLEAESGQWAQTGSAGRAQVSEMLHAAAEVVAIDNIHIGSTWSALPDSHESPQPETEPEWPTEEQETSGPFPDVVTSLKGPEGNTPASDTSMDTPPMGIPIQKPESAVDTDEARQNVHAAFGSDDPRHPEGQTVFKGTGGLDWERPAYNTVDIPNGPKPSSPDTSLWQAPGTQPETEHTLVPIDIRVDQQPSTGVAEQFEPENPIGTSKVDQFLTKAAAGLKRWYRASPTNNPDSRLKNKIAKGFSALGDVFKGKGESRKSLTAAEMDARDEEEYARVDALLGEGNDVTYDANGNAVVNAEPRQPKPTRRQRRRAQKLANSATGQPVRPQTAAESKLEEVRQQMDAANARRDRINDHLNHGEHDMVAHEIRDMPTRELLGLPADIVANLDTNAREQWEVRFVREAKPPYPPPHPQILRTEAGRQAYQDRYPNRKYSW